MGSGPLPPPPLPPPFTLCYPFIWGRPSNLPSKYEIKMMVTINIDKITNFVTTVGFHSLQMISSLTFSISAKSSR